MNIPPVLAGLGALAIGVIAGAILIALDFTILGVAIALGAVPAALVAWVVANDRA